MSLQMRIRVVMALAGVFYLDIIMAGMAGFTLATWGAATALFVIWHLLLHAPFKATPLYLAVPVQAGVAAIVLGVGHGLGALTGWAIDPRIPLGLALIVTLAARVANISASQAEQLQQEAERLRDGGMP